MASVIRGSDNFDSLASSGLGDGQTWQAFVYGTERVSGVTYTNTTGKAIMIAVRVADLTTSTYTTTITVDGITISQYIDNYTNQYYSFIVPNSSTYSFTYTGATLNPTWSELR